MCICSTPNNETTKGNMIWGVDETALPCRKPDKLVWGRLADYLHFLMLLKDEESNII